MNKNKHIFISIAGLLIIIMTCLFNQNIITKASSNSLDLLTKIYEKDSSYSDYNVDIISDDFDNNDAKEFFFVFTKKDTKKNDSMNYCADIWFSNGSEVTRVVKWKYILPDTYGSIKLSGKTYFRYDLSYATDNQTILLSVNNGKCLVAFRPIGDAVFDGDNTFSVLCSSYDFIYDKKKGYSYGHTWKNYYFYIDEKGFHEYAAKQISQKEFLKYSKADTILKNIKKEYIKNGSKITLQFLKRSNGLLHINISCDTKDSIYHYYKTYHITNDNKLILQLSDEGNYLKTIYKK